MQVVVPSSSVNDFHFDSTASSPYVSAPSSPKRFGDPFDYYYHYTSAPTSPSRVAAIFASSAVPFGWEDKPGTPRSPKSHAAAAAAGGGGGRGEDVLDDFAFDFSGQLEKGVPLPDLTTADELFEKGKIRPLKPPPRLYNFSLEAAGVASSPTSPKSPKSPNKGLRSPRARGRAASSFSSSGERFDPFTAAMVEATRERGRDSAPSSNSNSAVAAGAISSSRSRKGSRSLSPMRSGVAGFFQKSSNSAASPKATTSASSSASNTIGSECLKTTGSGSGRKWRLRDLLLFRSASEGRVTGNKSKDPLRKYTIMSSPNSSPSASLFSSSPIKRAGDDSRNSSFRSTDSGGSIRRSSDGGSMRRGGVSPHEMHYMSNRAASEEMKKKTALPFNRQGFFGCLRFNPAVHSIARGFHNSYSFGRRP